MRSAIRTALVGAVATTLVLGLLGPAPAAAYPDAPSTVAIDGACEGELLRLHNQARAQAGVAALREDSAIDQVARTWALQMARSKTLAHNSRYAQQIAAAVPSWQTMAENVGYAATPAGMHAAYMGSGGHKANILNRQLTRVGIGCARAADGRIWTVVDLVGASAAIADRRPAPFRSAGDASARLRYWLLARGPDASQIEADATNLLARGWNADDLAVQLATSSSHGALVPGVVRLYGASFDRNPDAAGLQYWVARRQADGALDRIAQSFVNAPEFRTLYGSLGDAAFVDRVYRNVLGRAPDSGGSAYWVDQLKRGTSRGKLMIGFSESPENRAATLHDVTVSWAFAQLIDRMPTAAERSQWRGRSVADVVRFLVGSHAFAARVGTGAY